jgi:hypothetical protein
LSFGKSAKISSIDLYLAISSWVEEAGQASDVKVGLRDGETKADDRESRREKEARETMEKGFIVMNDCLIDR